MKVNKTLSRNSVKMAQSRAAKTGLTTREQYRQSLKLGLGVISAGLFGATLLIPAMYKAPKTVTRSPYTITVHAVADSAPKKTLEFPTEDLAMTEMCDAGGQYALDVRQGLMTVEQGKQEVRSYSFYLSENSPASRQDLLAKGMLCSGLWN